MKKYPVIKRKTANIGDVFGNLTVCSDAYYIYPKDTKKHRRQYVDCKCKCGNIRLKVNAGDLKRGGVHYYCGYECVIYQNELPKDVPIESKLVKVGEKYNYLTIIEESFYEKRRGDTNRQRYVRVKCKCNKIKVYREDKVFKGAYKSCGCVWESKNSRNYSSRKTYLKTQYNLSIQEYEDMLNKQDRKCAICLTDKPTKHGRWYNFIVDHCHKTGKIRGLLCDSCNRGLGMFGDNLEGIKRAVRYLM